MAASAYSVVGDVNPRLPDALPEFTKTGIPSSDILTEWFGPGRRSALNPYDAKATDLDTIVERYAGTRAQQFSTLVVLPMLSGGGYAVIVCPMERSQGIAAEWRRVSYQGAIMDEAPELTAPSYVTHTSETHSITLSRFSKGARMGGDFYLTDDGKQTMANQTLQLSYAAWATVISMFEHTVINAKNYYQDWAAQYGIKSGSFASEIESELALFGILSKDDIGIYKVLRYVNEKMTKYPPKSAIFGHGVSDFIALTGDFEYNAQKNPQNAQGRLLYGGESLKGTLKGILDIYETSQLEHQYSTSTEEKSKWRRDVNFSRCAIMCGEEQRSFYDGTNTSCSLQDLYKFQHISIDIDDWKTMDIKWAWRNSMRFDEKGRTHPLLHSFVGVLFDIAQNAGITIHNNLVDPYIWHSPKMFVEDGEYPTNGGYHVVRYWGDMDPRHFTFEQQETHGRIAANIIAKKKKLTDKDYKNMVRLEGLRKQLANPPDLSDSVVGSILMATMIKQNRNSNSSSSQLVKRSGSTGAPELPYRVQDRVFPDVYFLSDTKTGGDTQKALWVIYQDNTTTVNLTKSTLGSPSTWQQRENDAVDALGTTSADISAIVEEYISAEPIPLAYILAPLNAFGDVTTSDAARRVAFNIYGDEPITEAYLDALGVDSQFLPTKYKTILAALKNANLGEETAGSTKKHGSKYLVGGLKARLVTAPAMPYGWAAMSHITELANRHAEGGRGWSEYTKIASEGLESRRKYDSILDKLYPDNALIDSKYCPYFMKTQVEHTNRMYSLDVNVIHGPMNPLFTRRPQLSSVNLFGRDSVGIFTPALFSDEVNRDDDSGLLKIAGDLITSALANLGFPDPGATLDTGVVDFITLFYRFLNDELCPVAVKEMILDRNDNGRLLAKAYASLASSYVSLKKDEGTLNVVNVDGNPVDINTFAYFFLEEIYKPFVRTATTPEELKKPSAMFGSFMQTLYLIKDLAKPNDIDRQFIERLANTNNTRKRLRQDSKKFQSYKEDRDEIGKEAGGETVWINNTLVLDNTIFATYAKNAIDSGDQTQLKKLMLLPISPSDPENPHFPLFYGTDLDGIGITEEGGVPSNPLVASKASYLKLLRHAKAKNIGEMLDQYSMQRSGAGMGATLPLHLQPLKRGDMKARIDNFEDNIHERLTYDANEHEFVEDQDVVNERGDLIKDKSTMVKRINLIKRWKRMGKLADDFARHPAQLLCFTRVNEQSLCNWVTNGVPTPDDTYIFAEVFDVLSASFGLFTSPNVGKTLYNYEDAVLNFDGVHKQWDIHFTAWFGIAFQIPEAMLIVKDIMWHGYKSGLTADVYTDPEQFNPEKIDFTKSGFIFTCGSAFTRSAALKFAHPLPLYGKYHNGSIPMNVANRDVLLENKGMLWPAYLYYSYVWGFHAMPARHGPVDSSTFYSLKMNPCLTGLMFQMRTRKMNPHTGQWEVDYKGSGHLGELDPPLRPRLSGKITTIVNKKL